MDPSTGNNLLPPQVSRGDDPTKLTPNPKKPAVRFERTVSQAPSTHLGASNHSVGGRRIVEALDRGVFTSRTPGSASNGRNLVVCIDGTSNQFGTKNTNVVKLYSAVEKSDQQLSYYNSGIGTYADPSWKSWTYVKQVIDNKVDLAIAWNFEKIVLGAYRWLCDNWREGDKIYLFGFSRGAYQVRTLAGMIQRVGLLYPGNAEQIPFAYELYSKQARKQKAPKSKAASPKPVPTIHIEVEAASPSDSKSPEEKSTGGGTVGKSSGTMATDPASRAASGTRSLGFLKAPFSGTPAHETRRDLAAHFKSTFSREDVKVHFVGVWDTVSSIGIFRGKALPLTDSADHVTYFRHALALDERRVKFLPEYVNGGCCSLGDETRSMDDGGLVHIKEVWFPGTHSDIGGGNSFNPDPVTLENAPYLWMSAEAASCGLKLKVPVVDSLWERPSEIKESLEWPWYPLEIFPFRVLAYTDSSKTLVGMHRGRGRQMQHNQKLHPSIAYCAPEYKPKAKLPPGETRNFSSIVGMGADQDKTGWRESWQDVLEDDITDLRALLQHLASCTKQEESGWQYRISLLTSTDKGCQRLLETGHIIQLATIFTAKPANSELHDFVLNILEKLCGSAPTTIRGHALRVWCGFSARSLERPDDRRLAVRCLAYSLYTAYITSQEQRQGDDRCSKAIDDFKETLVTLKKEKPGLDVLLEAIIKDLTSPATLNPPLPGKEGGAENLAPTAIVADAVDDIPNDVHNIDLNFAQASLLEEVDGCPVGLQLCSKNKGLADLLLTHGLMETILETTQQQPMKTFSRTLFYFCSALEQDILDPPMTQAVIDYVGLAFYSHFPPTPANTDSSAIQCRILNFLAASIAHVGKTWLWTEATVLALIDSLSNQGIRQCVIDTLRASLDESCVATIMSTPRIVSEFRKLLGSNIPSMNRLAIDFFKVSASSSDVNFCDRVWSGETVQQLRELLSHGDWKRRLASVECFSKALSNTHMATSVFKPEVIAQIEERLSDTDADVVAKTVELYSKADKVSEALQDELWKASVLKRCLELLSWDSWYIRRSVVDLSRAVLSQPRFQSDQASSKAMIGRLLSNGLKDNWLGVLRDGDDAVRDSAAGMLTSATEGNAKDNLWTTEVSAQLRRQLEGGTSDRLLAINSLLIATAQPQLYERVFTPEIVKSFFNCLSSWSNWTIRLRALDVLEAIAKQDQVYEPMWNDQTVKVLRERLNDHDYDVRSKALDCLTAAVAKEPLLKIITLETVIDAIEHQLDANSSSWRARCAAISLMKEALIHDRFAGHYKILHPHDRSRIHWNLRHSVSDYDEDVRASALDFLIVVASRAGPLLHQVFDDDMITAIRSRARDDIPRVSDAYWELVKQLSESHHVSWAHLITVHDVTTMLEGFYEGNAEEREHSKLQLEELLGIEELRHLFVAGLSARAATRFQLTHI